MSKGAATPEGMRGKTRVAELAEKSYQIVKRTLFLVLLFSASQWLVVHSPVLKPAQLTDALGLALCSLAIAGAAILLTSILGFVTKKTWHKQTEEQKRTALWSIFTISSILCFVLLIFSGSTWIFSTSKLTDTARAAAGAALSNASTFALFVVASLISIMALFGWQNLSSHIDSRVKNISQEAKNEMIGRFFSMAGHTIGELNATDQGFEARNPKINESAIEFSRLGHEQLKNLSEGPRLMALNNYVYYTCLQKETSNAPWLLKQGLVLREAGLKYRVARLVLTYCQVVARYNRDQNSRRLAFNLLNNIRSFAMDEKEREEAQYCESLFKDPSLPYELKDF